MSLNNNSAREKIKSSSGRSRATFPFAPIQSEKKARLTIRLFHEARRKPFCKLGTQPPPLADSRSSVVGKHSSLYLKNLQQTQAKTYMHDGSVYEIIRSFAPTTGREVNTRKPFVFEYDFYLRVAFARIHTRRTPCRPAAAVPTDTVIS